MRRFLALLVVLLVGCGGAVGSSSATGQTGASSVPSAAGGPAGSAGAGASGAPSAAPGAASQGPAGSSAAALPPDCAEGFAAYLVAIEPLVSGFDPAKATLQDLSNADDAVHEKSMELLKANDSRAPYSCPDEGLDWAYFDASTAWDAALSVAGKAAPGTVSYLTAVRALAHLDVATLQEYGVDGCDAAVSTIKKRVAAESKGGASGVEAMGLDDGLAMLGLYRAYMRDVRTDVCPRDALGNDEFDFVGRMG